MNRRNRNSVKRDKVEGTKWDNPPSSAKNPLNLQAPQRTHGSLGQQSAYTYKQARREM